MPGLPGNRAMMVLASGMYTLVKTVSITVNRRHGYPSG